MSSTASLHSVAARLISRSLRSAGGELWLHEWLLGMWGTPIGEMLDLETLSEICKRNNRWSFFVTGAPLRGEC